MSTYLSFQSLRIRITGESKVRIRNGLKEIFLFYFPGSLVQEHGQFEAFMFVLTDGVKAV